ncbi:calvin cycle protein CP12-3, chloroplastic-like [Populus nigra]|uniref:calvin cycle protein CP12-3, chloroplastic-like n=1 Tax=Populus nigra TaxID=3691 RepID=UPI002B265261|nr:calvin cycle protein CP12-3, chloroplastic-like [Populus nigra]
MRTALFAREEKKEKQMASLSLILSSSNFSLRSDAFGDKLLSIRPVAIRTTGRDTSKRAMKAMRVKASMGGGGGGVARFKGTLVRNQLLTEMIEKKVIEAKEACKGDATSVECKVAWDEVEEVSQAKADFRLRLEKQDPLEYYCQDNPETDECRIYED